MDVQSYPQLFVLDYEGKAENIQFFLNRRSLEEMVARVKKGLVGDESSEKIHYIHSRRKTILKNIVKYSKNYLERQLNVLINTPMFGGILLLLNILFVLASWRIAGIIGNALTKEFIGESAEESKQQKAKAQ